jgi:hypothetical protein
VHYHLCFHGGAFGDFPLAWLKTVPSHSRWRSIHLPLVTVACLARLNSHVLRFSHFDKNSLLAWVLPGLSSVCNKKGEEEGVSVEEKVAPVSPLPLAPLVLCVAFRCPAYHTGKSYSALYVVNAWRLVANLLMNAAFVKVVCFLWGPYLCYWTPLVTWAVACAGFWSDLC